MKKKLLLLPFLAALAYFTLSSYINGPALSGYERTGATNSLGCGGSSGCHGAASSPTTTTTVTVELQDAGVAVTSYTPGHTYDIVITGTNTSSTFSLPDFGFQVAAVLAAGAGTPSAASTGTFGTLPTGTHSTTLGAITVVEHSMRLTATSGTGGSGTTYVETIPWTAPASGTGTVMLYGIINAVDGDGIETAADKYNSNSATITESIVVAPITGDSTVCILGTTNLSDATPGGTWSVDNPLVASIDGSGVATGHNAGTTIVSYIVGSDTATTTLTVLGTADAGTISGSPTLCAGAASAYTSDGDTSGTWSTASTNISIDSDGTVTGISPGPATITYTVTTACGSDASTFSIMVQPATDPGAISGPPSVCAGATIHLSDDSHPGGTWSASNTSADVDPLTGDVNGISAGTDTISYTVTGLCGPAAATYIITVLPAASAGDITGPSSVCIGSDITLSDTAIGGTWSSSDDGVATVSPLGVVHGVSMGSINIIYAVSTVCGMSIATYPVTVNDTADAGFITGPPSLCTGSTVIYSDASPDGAWSVSNANATIDASGFLTAISAGMDTIYYTVSGSCGTAVAAYPVTINLSPDAGTISGMPVLCIGTLATFTDTASGGIWSVTTAAAAISPAGDVTPLVQGPDTALYTVTTTCGSAAASYPFLVLPVPVAGTISGPSSVCTGTTITLSGVMSGGTWSSTNDDASVADGVVTGIMPGMDTIKYVISNFCGADSASQPITVLASPDAGTLTGPATLCTGETGTLADTAAGGAFSASNGSAIISGTDITGVSNGTDTISYSVTNTCGTATSSITIAVSAPANAGTITGADTVCEGAMVTLTDDGDTGGVWSASNGDATTAEGVVTGVTAGTDTISYTVINVCSSATATHIINVSPAPHAGTLSGPATLCTGSTVSFTGTATGGTYSSSNGSATVTPAGDVTGVANGIDTILYTVVNSCGTDIAMHIITVSDPAHAGTISGPAMVCEGSSITLTTDGDTGGAWDAVNSDANVMDGVVTGITAGMDTIRYIVTNACNADTARYAVTVNPLPVAGTISGPAAVCAGSTVILINAAPGGIWSASNASATVSVTGDVTGVSEGRDTISYTVINTCGTATATYSISVDTAADAGTISGLSSVCVGSSITLSDGAAGGTFSASNATATVDASGIVSGISAGTDTISYSQTNACGTAAATSAITVNPLPDAGSITGASFICIGAMTTLTDVAAGGAWRATNASATVDASGVVTGISSGIDTIVYTVTNVCGTDSVTHVINVGLLPSAGTITGPSSVCAGSSITLSDATAGGTWRATNAHATVAGGTVTGVTAGTDTVIYAITSACGTAADSAFITINPLPDAGAITGTTAVCAGSSVTLSDAAAGGSWSSSNALATVSASGVATGVAAGTDTIYYISSGVCGADTAMHMLTINTSPMAGIISGPSIYCTGTAFTLTDTAAGGTGIWSASNDNATIDATGAGMAVSTGADTISYTVTNACGAAVATSYITIRPMPAAGSVTGADTVCQGSTVTFTDTASGGLWSGSTSLATVSSTGVVTGVAPGASTITYTVINACGTAIATHGIVVYPAGTVAAITGSDTVCQMDTITLGDPTPGGTWSSSSADVTVSASGVVTGVSPGTATISYSVTGRCGAVVATAAVTVRSLAACTGTTAIAQAQSAGNINVYPNPSNGDFIVELPTTGENASVMVMDMYGKIIAMQNAGIANGQKVSFSLKNVAAGNYIIKVDAGANTYRQKLLIW